MRSYSSTSLWVQLPYEIHLDIFRSVFFDLARYSKVIEVENSPSRISLRWENEVSQFVEGEAICCLDGTVFGARIATAAAEALYQSDFVFAVDAEALPRFLRSCPLSHAVHPQRYIKRINVYVDEDPNFVGDGKDAQQLRKADWVDIEGEGGSHVVTSLHNRNELMRQCWKDLLNMPQLSQLIVMMHQAQGRFSGTGSSRWEIREFLPTYYRLIGKGVECYIHLLTWKLYEPDDDNYEDPLPSIEAVDENGFYEDCVDLSGCLPFLYAQEPPTARDRDQADATIASNHEWCSPSVCDLPNSTKYHVVSNYDAIMDLISRLKADPDYDLSDNDLIKQHQRGG